MAVGIINDMVRCTDCTFADSWGRGCSHSLMLPVVIALSGQRCDKFERKTNEQIELQLQQRNHNEQEKKQR